MKKNINLTLKRNAAKVTLFLISFIVAHLFLLIVLDLIIKPFFLSSYPKGSSEAELFATIMLILYIVGPVAVYIPLRWRGVDVKIMNYSEQQAEKRRKKIEDHLIALQRQQAIARQEKRESYFPIKLLATDKPFVFTLELSSEIDRRLLPQVHMNGIEIATKFFDRVHLLCFAKKAIKAEDKILRIEVSGGGSLQIPNPHFFDANCALPIVWQCEGHANERNIYLPAKYFPQALDFISYPFSIKVHKTYFGNFVGRLDKVRDAVVIPLHRNLHKSDCEQKAVSLILAYGNQEIIPLPRPVVLIRDGVAV